jgi:hypothetical protein
MISKDYQHVLRTGAYIEREIQSIIAEHQPCERRLFIEPGASVIDRYVEAIYRDGIEVMTLEVSGRAITIMNTGYREF